MKKIFSAIAVILLSFSICGFNNQNCFQLTEKIFENIVDKEKRVSAIIKLNYSPLELDNFFTDDLNTNQDIIMKKRKLNNVYYKNNNYKFANKYNLHSLNMDISEYSPFIFIDFDNYNDYESNRDYIKQIAKNHLVEKIFIEEKLEVEVSSTQSSGDCLSNIDMDFAKKMINADTTTYRGSGIKVGIIDAGGPDDITNFSNGQIKAINDGNQKSDHTTKVASIISGTYGIAPDSNLYIHKYEDITLSYEFDDAIEWLLPYGVNVINISMSSDLYNGHSGLYDGHSAYMDYIVWNNSVTIVKSAGNRGNEYNGKGMITNPGIGKNVFSVGSINYDGKVSDFSSYKVDSSLENILMKPTLVAPGENIVVPNTNNKSDNLSGTSFAAPMVTGVISLLMEEFPRLIGYPEIIMSTLISSASMLNDQVEMWDEYAGAGLVNYEAARKILLDSNYIDSIVTTSNNSSSAILSKEYTINAKSYVKFSLVNISNSNVLSPSETVYTPSFSKCSINVYDSSNNSVDFKVTGCNSNIIVGEIENKMSLGQKFTIKVTLNGNKVGVDKEYFGLTIYEYVHDHIYGEPYEWINYTQHNATCQCGKIAKQGHVISKRSYTVGNVEGSQYAQCMLCKGNAKFGFITMSEFANEINLSTPNGSFILPNGIIVLEDNDINDFMNGTLKFINKNESVAFTLKNSSIY